jgi:hypothetical protein
VRSNQAASTQAVWPLGPAAGAVGGEFA